MANYTLKELENNGLYSKDLIDSLKSKQFSVMKDLTDNQKKDSNYMYPLLWAVKEELGTFIVYSYMSEDLQSDTDITTEVVKSEPELFANSPLSSNRIFILSHIQSLPSLSHYMSPALKSDLVFIKELCTVSSPDVAKQILNNAGISDASVLESVPSPTEVLVDTVLVAALVSNPEHLAELSENQRNDYASIKAAAYQNEGIVSYVVEHLDVLGSEGIRAVREANEDILISSYGKVINESETKNRILNIDSLIDFEKLDKTEDPGLVAKLLAVGILTDNIDAELAQRAINATVLIMKKAKDDPEWLKNDPEAYKSFSSPDAIDQCLKVLEENGIQLAPNVSEMIAEYRQLHESIERPDFRTQEEIDEDKLADRLEAEAEAAGMSLEEYMKEKGIVPPPLYEEDVQEERPEETSSLLGNDRKITLEEVKDCAKDSVLAHVDTLTKTIKNNIKASEEPEIEQGEKTNDEI